MDIRPIAGPEFSFQEAESDVLPPLPLRMLALGNSGSGKTTALIKMITDPRFYGKKPWERVYWCSPTAEVDDALAPLRRYVEDVLKQDQEEDPTFDDHINVPFCSEACLWRLLWFYLLRWRRLPAPMTQRPRQVVRTVLPM